MILDEIQRMPELFQTLLPLCDRAGKPARFMLLGSASPSLVRGVSESLAGRVLFVHVPGFSIDETGAASQNRLWMRGGFPRAYLTKGAEAWHRWLDGFVTTFLERDIPQMGIRVPAPALRRCGGPPLRGDAWSPPGHCWIDFTRFHDVVDTETLIMVSFP
ncbi:MAG: AAA family ATPase [Candidatus Eisenbacteria bacterium]